MQTDKWIRVCALCGSAAVALAGCCSLSPNVDKHFGEATSLAKANQIANLDAGQNRAIPKLDGVAAADAIGQYQKTFKSPPPTTNVFNIGIGNGPAR